MGDSLWQGDDQRMGTTSDRDDAQVTPGSATTTSMIMSISGDPGGGEWVDQRGQNGKDGSGDAGGEEEETIKTSVMARGKGRRRGRGEEKRGEEKRGEERRGNVTHRC